MSIFNYFKLPHPTYVFFKWFVFAWWWGCFMIPYLMYGSVGVHVAYSNIHDFIRFIFSFWPLSFSFSIMQLPDVLQCFIVAVLWLVKYMVDSISPLKLTKSFHILQVLFAFCWVFWIVGLFLLFLLPQNGWVLSSFSLIELIYLLCGVLRGWLFKESLY